MTNEELKDKANSSRVGFALLIVLIPVKDKALQVRICEEMTSLLQKSRRGFWQHLIDTAIVGSLNLPPQKVAALWGQAASQPAYAPIHGLDELHRKQLASYLCIFGTFLKACREVGNMSSERCQEIQNVVTGSLFDLPDIPAWLETSLRFIKGMLDLSDEEMNRTRDFEEFMLRYNVSQLSVSEIVDLTSGELE